MSENTNIEWCDHTFNPWIGCTEVSCGCARCYAKTLMDARYHRVKWGKGQPRQRTSEANWQLPAKWNQRCARENFIQCNECSVRHWLKDSELDSFCRACGGVTGESVRPRVFCASLADWLDDEVPIEWLADLLRLIHDTPNLDWLLLTKRPENWEKRVKEVLIATKNMALVKFLSYWRHEVKTPANVWLGTTVENQEMADKRIPQLLEIPARVRFLSVEPMLGPIQLPFVHWCEKCHRSGFKSGTAEGCELCCGSGIARAETGLNWAIFGGESGPGARPCNIDWIRDGVRQCQAAGVAAFVKQLGADPLVMWPLAGNNGAAGLVRARKVGLLYPKAEAKPFTHPKGGDMAEWPEELRVREFPEVAR